MRDTSAYMWHTIKHRHALTTETSGICWSPNQPEGKRLPEREVTRPFSVAFRESLGLLPPAMLVSDLLTHAGLCDLLEANRLVHVGAVSVNGRVCLSTSRTLNPTEDAVSIAGRPLEDCVTVSYVIHKPPKFTSTATDALRRPSVFSLLPNPNWYYRPVDLLGYNCAGLLVLSNTVRLPKSVPSTWEVVMGGHRPMKNREVEALPFEKVDRVDDWLLRVTSGDAHCERSLYSAIPDRPLTVTRVSFGRLSLSDRSLARPGSTLAFPHLQL